MADKAKRIGDQIPIYQRVTGGWPQFWPKMRDYQIHITYNDDAMVNTMILLRDIAEQKEPYQGDLTDETLRLQMQAAFDKGIECILATQIVTDGELTVWCQQHDRETLKPAKASAYELPSYCFPRRHLSEIGSERRNGYGWYNSRPAMLFPVYEKWTLMH